MAKPRRYRYLLMVFVVLCVSAFILPQYLSGETLYRLMPIGTMRWNVVQPVKQVIENAYGILRGNASVSNGRLSAAKPPQSLGQSPSTKTITSANTATSTNTTTSTGTAKAPESKSQSEGQPKLIYAATKNYGNYADLNFKQCEYNNCIGRNMMAGNAGLYNATIAVFQLSSYQASAFPHIDYRTRQNQIWLLYTPECWAWGHNRWNPSVDGVFNGSMTNRHDAEFDNKIYRADKILIEQQLIDGNRDFSRNKTKGAFAYVSNCNSVGYNRLGFMRRLKEYIDVDIYGSCTGSRPCEKKFDYGCEARLHSQYRFFLSFENSLCSEYITEKFWGRLGSRSVAVPVVVGGASMTEYFDVAPPNSFIHAYNFSSVEALGKYLQHLMKDDAAYNRYHEWRGKYKILGNRGDRFPCKLCEMAHKMPRLPVRNDLSSWWNNGPIGHIPYKV